MTMLKQTQTLPLDAADTAVISEPGRIPGFSPAEGVCPRSAPAKASCEGDEEEVRRRGGTRLALTTLSIEAPDFYLIAATIDCVPPGLTRYYMMTLARTGRR